MIIACPSCHTRYRVQPASLGAKGRTVRCTSCGELWFVDQPERVDEPPPPIAPPVPTVAASSSPSTSPRWPWLVVTLLAVPVAALLLGRHELAAHYPALAPIYLSLGLTVEMPVGVEFRRLASSQRMEGEAPSLVVTGEIANVSGQPRQVPPIRIGLLDAQGREIDFALFDAPEPSLPAGGVEPFEIKLGPPPPEARDFSVSFANVP